MSWMEAAARWYVVLAVATWAFAPAVRWLCSTLADRGVTVARPLALLAAVYPAWLMASLGASSFSASLVWTTVVLAGIIGWAVIIRRNELDRSWIRLLTLTEIASAGLFAAYVWLRGYTPQILGTEKPMDIALLASSARATSIPPLDPWFAGEPINYYYLGYLLHGTVGRLSGVTPEVGFNLALATVFSATTIVAFGVAWNVVKPRLGSRLAAASGCFAAFAVALSGNLYAPIRLVQDTSATVSAWWWDTATGIGWRSSRIVCDGPRVNNLCPFPATETINEFPFFSFLLGDLHPHVMALPYTLVAITLAWNLAQQRTDVMQRRAAVGATQASPAPGSCDAPRLQTSLATQFSNRWSWWIRVALSGAVAGALYPLNAWDFPVFLLLLAIAVWVGAGASMSRAWKPLVVLGASSLLAWFPFWTTYVPPTVDTASIPETIARLPVIPGLLSAFALHVGERTSIAEYLTMFGAPYALGIALIVMSTANESSDRRHGDARSLLIAGVATIVPGVLLAAPVIPLCGIPLSLAIAQLRRTRVAIPRSFALTLFAFAWALSIGVELVYVRDVFDDRMNTLFKFYYQAWTMYALAAAVSIAVLWMAAAKRSWQRTALAGASIAAVVAGAIYPAVASWQWTEGFATWRGLDGIAYAEATHPDEVAAIRWLARNAEPGDVVLEAAGCSYLPSGRLPFNRVSAFTGVPTVIGWGNHERQWRAGQSELIAAIGQRQSDVREMYANPESPRFADYGVEWLFVGEYETGNWQPECDPAGPYEIPASSTELGPGWEDAFRSGNTRLYRRIESP